MGSATFDLPRGLFPEPGIFVLKVVGDSMTGDQINDGDHVVVDPGRVPLDNDVVVVHLTGYRWKTAGDVSDGWTLKHVRYGADGKGPDGNGLVFEASNPKYGALEPTVGVHGSLIRGVVIGVVASGPDGATNPRRIEGGVPLVD